MILFFFVQIFVVVVFGFVDGDMDGDLGPTDPFLVIFGTLCSTPFLLLFLIARKPKLAHIVRLDSSNQGSNAHYITPGTLIQSTNPTVLQHHLIHNTSPLEMPSVRQLWLIFIVGTLISSVFMAPILVTDINAVTLLLFFIVALPAWIIGFSTPCLLYTSDAADD